jgi:2-phosphoglycerate kinase
VLLIGGSSHVGKTTVARAVAERLGWQCRSTDKLARHPGRPWTPPGRSMPAHVAEHYLSREPDELLADVLLHYRKNVWPRVQHILAHQARQGLVLEGSANLPDLAAGLPPHSAAALWLTAGEDVLKQRIHAAGAYPEQSERGRRLIDRFLARTRLFDRHVVESAARHGLPVLRVDGVPVDTLAERCLAVLHAPKNAQTSDATPDQR